MEGRDLTSIFRRAEIQIWDLTLIFRRAEIRKLKVGI